MRLRIQIFRRGGVSGPIQPMGAGLFFIQGAARQPAAYEVIDSRFVLAAGTVLRNHPGLEGGHVRPVGETELHVVKTELFLPVILVEGKLGIVGRCAQIVQVLGDQNPGPFVGGRFLRRRFRGRLIVSTRFQKKFYSRTKARSINMFRSFGICTMRKLPTDPLCHFRTKIDMIRQEKSQPADWLFILPQRGHRISR